MLRLSRTLALVLATAPVFAFACDADLESSCREGTCGGGLTDPGPSPVCTTDDTHGFPCLVYQVIRDNCHECHVPDGIGPFPFLEYADTQAPYGVEGLQRWERMKEVIAKDNMGFIKMPQGKNENGDLRWPMSDEKLEIMNAWFATCVPDVGCEQAEGGAGGAGGAGGGGAGGAGGVAASGGGGAGGS